MDDSILKYVAQADEVWHAGVLAKRLLQIALKTKPIRAVCRILMMKARLPFPLHNRFVCEG
jgi:hypothetical protein